MRDFSSKEGFGRARIASAVAEFTSAFGELEARLASIPWLSGEAFGIADISWIVNVHRVVLARYPLARFPRLHGWYERMRARPSFQAAIRKYEDGGTLGFFALYSLCRRMAGTGIGNYM
jgi:glutathione S-transferase